MTVATEVTSGVFQVKLRFVSVTLIVENKLTLVDAGFRGDARPIAKFITGLGRSPVEIELIVVTHNHLDHLGGLKELRRLAPAARLAVHRGDIITGRRDLPQPAGGLMLHPPFSLLRPLIYLHSGQVDMPLAGGEVLPPLGGLQVLHTPGHTPGSISLYSPDRKLLLVGDTMNRNGDVLQIPDRRTNTDQSELVASLRRLAALDFSAVCFGHGRPLTSGAGAAVQRLAAEIDKDG